MSTHVLAHVLANVPIRGLWSVVVVVALLLGTIILALTGWWDDILEAVVHSHVYLILQLHFALAA